MILIPNKENPKYDIDFDENCIILSRLKDCIRNGKPTVVKDKTTTKYYSFSTVSKDLTQYGLLGAINQILYWEMLDCLYTKNSKNGKKKALRTLSTEEFKEMFTLLVGENDKWIKDLYATCNINDKYTIKIKINKNGKRLKVEDRTPVRTN